MHMTGRCYCGDVRFTFEGEPLRALQCHCRECQYISGGNPNAAMVVPKSGFRLDQGEPQTFARTDIDAPRTRWFCGRCGTSLVTLSPRFPDAIILKVGTLDDPSVFEPTVAQYLKDKQPFHCVADGVECYDTIPGAPARPD